MSQNRSSAVMQQRREAKDSLDDFPTQPWAVRALCEWLEGIGEPLEVLECREPAANRGYMVRALAEYFHQVRASDVFDYGVGYPVDDYLFPGDESQTDWTITNAPFRLAQEFIAKARATSSAGVAMFVRSAFLEGQERYETLFSIDPPHVILQFSERVVIHRGKVTKEGSSATAYCWLIWLGPIGCRAKTFPVFCWVPPCRRRLEMPSDYDPPPVLE